MGDYFLTWRRKNMMSLSGIEYNEIEKNFERIIDDSSQLVEIKEESEENKKFYVTFKQAMPEISIEKYACVFFFLKKI
jgi:hypothetical protein